MRPTDPLRFEPPRLVCQDCGQDLAPGDALTGRCLLCRLVDRSVEAERPVVWGEPRRVM